MEKLLNRVPVDKIAALGLSKSDDAPKQINSGSAYHSYIRPKTQQFKNWYRNVFEDLTGQQLGELTIIGVLYGQPKYTSGTQGGLRWVVKCRCKKYEIRTHRSIKKASLISCRECLKINFVTTEFVQSWPDGKEEVKYRRNYGSESARELMSQIDSLPKNSGYFYRHIKT